MDYLFRPTYLEKDRTLSWANTILNTTMYQFPENFYHMVDTLYSLVRVTTPSLQENLFICMIRTLKRVSRRKANK